MIVVIGRYGRLGNQLWTHANVLAFCLQWKLRFYSAVFDDGALFRRTSSPAGSANLQNLCVESWWARSALLRGMYKLALRLPWWPVVHVGERNCLDMDQYGEKLSRLAVAKTTFLAGLYFSAPESMREHRSDILEYFSPAQDVQGQIDLLLKRARVETEVLVGVHIRGGDYKTYCEGVMYYTVAEYADVMRHLACELTAKGRVRFLVCSDEDVDVDEFAGLDVLVSRAVPLVDMYSLARCDFILAPNSTFSQWASFYGNVPLHILDYKAVEKFGLDGAQRRPDPEADFAVFDPSRFVVPARKRVDPADLLGRRWLE